jgi:Protein of unknown function (DUF2798)
MVLLMTKMMGLLMSAWHTWLTAGFGPAFLTSWGLLFLSTSLIATPAVFIVSPIAQRLARWIDQRLTTI